eukprot:3196588-Prorocentrum_lima.AAC.1
MTSSLVGSEMCIRDSQFALNLHHCWEYQREGDPMNHKKKLPALGLPPGCLLYTSDAADDM